ncbi:hypothetical protein J1614_007375 [Plenodomus biglobosus]|nr:hypothetical protein J1614_007375 [Plenodomus biglobosus]
MAHFLGTLAGLSLTSVALASPPTHLYARQNASSPCAEVSAIAATKEPDFQTVPAQLAYECLQSIPFNQSGALALIDSITPYLKWQSTTAWLKDPPAEYVEKVQDPVDLWGELDDIRERIHAGDYNNEFEFGFELYSLFQRPHDSHLFYAPDVVSSIFTYVRPVPLVSVSSDGQELPEPYVYSDVLDESLGNVSYTPSRVYKIDGQDAKTFLENWSQHGSVQDRDALYNDAFYNLATVSMGNLGWGVGSFASSGRASFIYPGATTELEFENGTTRTYKNIAILRVPFNGITDGESLYQTWLSSNQIELLNKDATPTPTANASSTPMPTVPAPGYPPPVVREARNLIGGYYLEDDMSDVAVLSVPSFVNTDGQLAFQATAVKFLADAKASGKKKLIIDLQSNSGGTIMLGYDLYKMLFPSLIEHAAADRFRAFEATNIAGQDFSRFASHFPRINVTIEQNATQYNATDVIMGVFNSVNSLDVDSQPFTSWADMFGPVSQKGDNFTQLFRWNLADPMLSDTIGFTIHGHGRLSNYTTTPFAAADVVVVTDGLCGSTCSIFAELMRQRAGVKFISLGGRARPGLTQAVGGVRGTNVYNDLYINDIANALISYTNSSLEESHHLNTTTELRFLRGYHPIRVNFRDAIRDGDESCTPLQFVYEVSDCRILYTKMMTVDVTVLWEAVAETAWGAKSHCVAGGLGEADVELGWHGKREVRHEHEHRHRHRALRRRMKGWRSELKVEDYPLDLRPDVKEMMLHGHVG